MKDIKSFIDITDISFYLFIITILFGLYLAFWAYKKAHKFSIEHCKINCEKYFLYKFTNVDWNNPKKAVYDVTFYGRMLARTDRRKEIFLQLKKHLDRYKYTKEIEHIDEDLINYYNLYKQVCDE